MKTKDKIRKARLSQWSTRFQDQAASGMSVKDWCTKNNISVHAYYYWKHIAKEAYVDSIIPDIVPITPPIPVVNDNVPVSESHDSRTLYNLRELTDTKIISVSIGDTRIEIGSSATDEMILAIIKAVRYA